MSSLKFNTTDINMQTTSSAIWWIKNPALTKNTTNQRRRKHSEWSLSLANDFTDLFRNMSIHGYSHLFDPELSVWEKIIWLTLHVATLCGLLMVLSASWQEFVSQYIVNNLHNPTYPIEMVPFPAVSICSNNRISRQAAKAYAEDLHRKDPRNRSVEFFYERMSYFSQVNNRGEIENDFDDFSIFQTILDLYDTLDNETFFNTKRKMDMLTPACKSFILHCYVAGIEVECLGDSAFRRSLTMYGACCTFNKRNSCVPQLLPSNIGSYGKREYRYRLVDSSLGLTVVLNNSRVDYFSPLLQIDGYVVIVHDPNDYPDVSSGSQEVFPSHGMESFLSIRARIIDTSSELRTFSPTTRKCYFDDEAPVNQLLPERTYSFPNCITRCRIRSIVALCRCLPYYMPYDLGNQTRGVVYCTLQHITCLFSYGFKWRNVLTEREMRLGLEREVEEALYCPQCLPSCVDIQYKVSLMSLPLDRYYGNSNINQFGDKLHGANGVSVLRVYFAEPHARYYRRVIANTWFEALCTVGNIFSIFVGLSIVIVFEILFLVFKYFSLALRLIIQQNAENKKAKHSRMQRGAKQLDTAKLYICP